MKELTEIKEAKLISVTPDAEKTMAYIARVSSPNQDNPEYSKLLKYCLDKKHWSVFESAYMTVEINTSRAISAQILRHRSFTFSEFSQRYAEAQDFVIFEARRQDKKNRQNSTNDLDPEIQKWFYDAQSAVIDNCERLYSEAIEKGIAKECARMLLPQSTATKIYMTGSVRSWIHYIQLRTDKSTQLEHRAVAEEIKKIFIEQFPVVSKALDLK